jgi:hypothetical protein
MTSSAGAKLALQFDIIDRIYFQNTEFMLDAKHGPIDRLSISFMERDLPMNFPALVRKGFPV